MDSSEFIIYVLKLEKNKRYIGYTKNLSKRLIKHFKGQGAKATQKYKPLYVEKIFVFDEYKIYKHPLTIEHDIVKQYVKKYGYRNVRGGNWTNSLTF